MKSDKPNILLVEDNKDHVALIARWFGASRDNMELVVAESIVAAEEILQRFVPAVILSDYLLPDGTGLDILHRHVAGNPLAPAFVLLTSHGDETVAVQAMKSGATDYIVKSDVALASLPEVCRAILREHEQRLENARAMEALYEKQKLNEILLAAIPHTAMLIRGKDRVVVAANKIALQSGVRIGDHCWRTFAKSALISEVHKGVAQNYPLDVPAELDIQCCACKGDLCLSEIPEQNDPEVAVGHSILDAYWIKVSDDIFLHYLVDITERREAEVAVEQSRERYRLLAESTSGITWELDLVNDRWTYVAPQAQRILGYAPEEFTDFAWWLEHLHADDRAWANAYCLEKTGIGEDHALEYRFLAKDGRVVWVNDIVSVEKKDGKPVMVRGIMLDITERKQMEEKLRQSLKMESVGRLAGGVAHDFNNKLTVILGYTELLQLEFPENRRIQERTREISRAAEHSRDITGQLLAFSRQQIISPKVLDLNAAIKDTQRTLPRLIGEDIALTFELATPLWNVKIDPTQLDQVLMNLALNARDAMANGGSLRIATANASIDDAFCREFMDATPGDYVQLSIDDNGCGMDPETCKRIFEPFFTTKEVGKGTGLGLATIYGIVTQNDGFITVRSAPGLGTTFKVHLPRWEEAVVVEAKESTQSIRGKGTILLVEDDEYVRKMTCAMLEITGYIVLATETPGEAISLCKRMETRVDLVVSDVVMPGMNGKEMMGMLEILRPGIPVLYMSGYSSEIISMKGVSEGSVHFIQKPFDMNELNAKVRSAMAPASGHPA